MLEILASELAVGDVFVHPRRANGLQRVTKINQVNIGTAYSYVEYTSLAKVAGKMNLRHEVKVQVVAPVEKPRALKILAELEDGQDVTFWHAEGRVWA